LPVRGDDFKKMGLSEGEEPDDERRKNLGAGRKDYVGSDREVVVKISWWKRFVRWRELRAERRRRRKLEKKLRRAQLEYEKRRRKCKWCEGTGRRYSQRLQREVTCPECIEPKRPRRWIHFTPYE
jgi:DnaJ-class molecular chaperone